MLTEGPTIKLNGNFTLNESLHNIDSDQMVLEWSSLNRD